MARLWFCPKCSTRIVITVLMEDFPFHCPNCDEIWGREDMEHFAMGLSTFDVADVHDWLEQRKTYKKTIPEETVYEITAREQILISYIEAALNTSKRRGDDLMIGALEECIKKFGEACRPVLKNLPMDWCEAQYQQERRNDARRHTI